MSEYDVDLETVEVSMEQAKEAVERFKAMQRLTKNRDFKKIVLEGYFEKEPVRLCILKSDHAMQNEESQAAIIKQIDAIGSVRQYFHMIMQMGRMAEKELESLEEAHAEMLAEA